jgi:heat shock protein HslJ
MLICSVFIAGCAVSHATDKNLAGLENATYAGIEEQPVTLSQGRWEGPPYQQGFVSRPTVGLVKEVLFRGDLDADGEEELVVMLWQSAAGTGSNIYIAVMKPHTNGFENISTALLGDRVKLRGGRIDSGRIVLEVLQAGENDAMCCPTELATRSWSLQGGRLAEQEKQVTGKLSLGILDGSSWRLTRLDLGRPVPAEAEVTLAFDAGRIAGKSACNRYSADIGEGEGPGEIHIGQAITTRMACAEQLMEIEMHYLQALAMVTGFSFHAGSLALTGQTVDGVLFSMLFTAATADTP